MNKDHWQKRKRVILNEESQTFADLIFLKNEMAGYCSLKEKAIGVIHKIADSFYCGTIFFLNVYYKNNGSSVALFIYKDSNLIFHVTVIHVKHLNHPAGCHL
jgi:hypothetical protein